MGNIRSSLVLKFRVPVDRVLSISDFCRSLILLVSLPDWGTSDSWYDWDLADLNFKLDETRVWLISLVAGATSAFNAGTLPRRIAMFLSMPDQVRPRTVLKVSGFWFGGGWSCAPIWTVRIMAKIPVLSRSQLANLQGIADVHIHCAQTHQT